MKGKQLATLLALVVVIGGLGWFLIKGNQSSWKESSGNAGGKILKLQINDVADVEIKATDGELGVAKKGDIWVVKQRADYPANFEKIGDLVRKFWELKSVQEVKVGPSQMARLELVEPGKEGKAGTVIEFKDKDGKRLAAILLGKKYMKKSDSQFGDAGGFPGGRYVLALDGGNRVALVSETFDEVDTKPEQWIAHDFFKLENPKAITFNGTAEGQKWKMTRESATGEWKLDDAKPDEKLDGGKIVSFATLLGNATFSDIQAPDAKPEDSGLDKPSVLTFETFDGFTYVLKIGKPTPDSYPVKLEINATLAKERTPGKDEKPEDKDKLDKEFDANKKKLEEKLAAEKEYEKRVYLMPKSTLDNYVKSRAELLAPKTEPAPANSEGAATPRIPGAPGAPGAPTGAMPAPGTSIPVIVSPKPGSKEPAPAPLKATVVTPPIAVPPLPPKTETSAQPTPAPPAPAPAAPAAAPAPSTPPAVPPAAEKPAPAPETPVPAAEKPAPAPAPAAPPAETPAAAPGTPPPAAAPASPAPSAPPAAAPAPAAPSSAPASDSPAPAPEKPSSESK